MAAAQRGGSLQSVPEAATTKWVAAGERGELYAVPAMAWIASFTLCTLADVMLGRWVFLPLLVAGFYGGTIIIALVTYPLLSFWRAWTRRRGLLAWYLIEVGGLWGATMVVLILFSPWWLRWSWSGTSSLQVLGLVLFVGPVVAGTWAVAKMGWARLLLAGALLLGGAGAEENGVPQRLVVEGPYRYVRNPLYDGDFCLIVGAALLTRSWALVLVAALDLALLAFQLPFEERELRERFGVRYRRYCELVPRFVPRRRPVNQRDLNTRTGDDVVTVGRKESEGRLPRRVVPDSSWIPFLAGVVVARGRRD